MVETGLWSMVGRLKSRSCRWVELSPPAGSPALRRHRAGRARVSAESLLYPLCVVDASRKAAGNPDYALTADDLRVFELQHGAIPQGALVAMRTDWSLTHADNPENRDGAGVSHHPGWTAEALRFLTEERRAAAVGFEPAEADPPALCPGLPGRRYLLGQDTLQITGLTNLDRVPAAGAILLCTHAAATEDGFLARCSAVFER